MKQDSKYLRVALLATALLLLVFFWTALLGEQYAFILRGTLGTSLFQHITTDAALVASAGLYLSLMVAAVAIAVQPAHWATKLVYALPLFILVMTFVGVIAYSLGIGTTGTVMVLNGTIRISFTAAWVGLGTLLGVLSIVLLMSKVHMGARTYKTVHITTAMTAVPSVVTWLGLAVIVSLVITNQTISAADYVTVGTSGVTYGARTVPAGVGDREFGLQNGRGNGRQSGTNRAAGSTVVTNALNQFTLNGILATLFGMVVVISIVGGLHAYKLMPAGMRAAPASLVTAPRSFQMHSSFPFEVAKGVVRFTVLFALALALCQLLQVPRTNPPVHVTGQWDSPQTEQLWNRACGDCHSNETQWPWYTAIAPLSWIAAMDINEGRQQFNISELNTLPVGLKTEMPGMTAQLLRLGAMPPADYLLLHSDARLTDSEQRRLVHGISMLLGQ
jgi:hypothetical protein